MPKNIVFCADGTWNGPGESDTDDPNDPWTNVYKLFLGLAGQDDQGSIRLGKEQERTAPATDNAVAQVSKYLHGVGDSNNLLDKILGGGLGLGLITRIVRGYTFISRNYQPGDRIFLIGFSRGAYTVRALAGLISAQGLLPLNIATGVKLEAYRKGAAVWVAWRRNVLAAKDGLVPRFDDWLLQFPGFLVGQSPAAADMVQARIKTVAVWDTVGSLGIPVFNRQAIPIDFFQFADRALSDNIDFARHAVSIDEQRADFTPTLWDNPDPNGNRIVQGLFSGGHADVGGGYQLGNNESGLSNGALAWMRTELTRLPDAPGLRWGTPPDIDLTASFNGPSHEQWLRPPWPLLPRGPRNLGTGQALHQAVLDRMNAGAVFPDPSALETPYCPSNLSSYVVSTAGRFGAAPGVRVI
ncbi:MAG TPA: DUF2235 domain-containing protein [Stellaceae bacterium]|nr:DUF2235 domain-containing protein [Stellaceae bacterium]